MARRNGHEGAVVTPEAVAVLEGYARGRLPLDAIGDRTAWRDRSIAALRALKEGQGGAMPTETGPGGES